jgi:hypothetical protein
MAQKKLVQIIDDPAGSCVFFEPYAECDDFATMAEVKAKLPPFICAS